MSKKVMILSLDAIRHEVGYLSGHTSSLYAQGNSRVNGHSRNGIFEAFCALYQPYVAAHDSSIIPHSLWYLFKYGRYEMYDVHPPYSPIVYIVTFDRLPIIYEDVTNIKKKEVRSIVDRISRNRFTFDIFMAWFRETSINFVSFDFFSLGLVCRSASWVIDDFYKDLPQLEEMKRVGPGGFTYRFGLFSDVVTYQFLQLAQRYFKQRVRMGNTSWADGYWLIVNMSSLDDEYLGQGAINTLTSEVRFSQSSTYDAIVIAAELIKEVVADDRFFTISELNSAGRAVYGKVNYRPIWAFTCTNAEIFLAMDKHDIAAVLTIMPKFRIYFLNINSLVDNYIRLPVAIRIYMIRGWWMTYGDVIHDDMIDQFEPDDRESIFLHRSLFKLATEGTPDGAEPLYAKKGWSPFSKKVMCGYKTRVSFVDYKNFIDDYYTCDSWIRSAFDSVVEID